MSNGKRKYTTWKRALKEEDRKRLRVSGNSDASRGIADIQPRPSPAEDRTATPRLTMEQALHLIEDMAGTGEMEHAFKNEDACRRFGNIYAVAHSTMNECRNPHTREAEEAIASYDALAEIGELPPRNSALSSSSAPPPITTPHPSDSSEGSGSEA